MGRPLEYPGSETNTQNHLPERASIWAKAYRDDIKIDPQIYKGCKGCEFKADKHEKLKSGYHECLNRWHVGARPMILVHHQKSQKIFKNHQFYR